MRNAFKNMIINFYFNLSFFCSVETWSGARRRRRRCPDAAGGTASPLSGLGRFPRHDLW
jgi:hypothetical protein